MTKSEPIIELQNVSKRYRVTKRLEQTRRTTVDALKNVSLQVQAGESVGVIGRNGAGKTTLLRVIGNTCIPSSGQVIRQQKPRMVLDLGHVLLDQFTGRENLYMYASFLGILNHEIDRSFDQIVHFAELESVIDEPLRNYSAGMHARLAFSVATSCHPQLICIDEILSVGDLSFRQKSSHRLAELINEGVTMIMASHSLESLTKITSRFIWLEQGQLLADNSPDLVRAQYQQSQSQTV